MEDKGPIWGLLFIAVSLAICYIDIYWAIYFDIVCSFLVCVIPMYMDWKNHDWDDGQEKTKTKKNE